MPNIVIKSEISEPTSIMNEEIPDSLLVAYFELNPGVSSYCFDISPDDREYLQDNKIFFKPALHGNDFNLVYLWIE